MKKGIHDVPFLSVWNWEQFIVQAANAGFEGVEFNLLEEGGYLSLGISPIEALQVAQRCRDFGLQISSLSTSLHNKYSLASSNKSIRKRAEEIALRMIELAQLLDAEVIQVVPGVVVPETRYDQSYQWAQESLARLATVAAEAGIIIGIENVSNKFLPSPQEFVRFIEEIQHPVIQAYFDVGNAMATGHPEHWIPLLGSLIKTVHVKDYHTATGTFLSPLSGDIHWPIIIDELQKVSFKSFLISTPPKYAYCPERLIESAFMDLDAIVKLGRDGTSRQLPFHQIGGITL